MTDFVVGPGVLWGRRRWRWMTARAAMNLALAACYAAEASRNSGNRRARVGVIAMGSLTIVDGALAVALAAHAPEEDPERHPVEGAHLTD
jgi:hypothetical protein